VTPTPLRRPAAAVLALASGLALPLALAPFDLWPASLVATGGLLAALWGQGARTALLLGWIAGVGRYGLGVSWVYVSIHEHGNASPLLAGTLVVLFVAALALLPALMALAFARLAPATPVRAALVFTGCWALLEWALTWLLTGFPWLLAGTAHLDSPLAGWLPVTGVLGVSAIVALTGATIWAAVVDRRRTAVRVLGGVAAGLWALGALLGRVAWTEPDGPTRSVALVQGAIPQAIKWRPESRERIVDTYLALSSAHWGVDLIVWPEAALTVYAPRAGALLERLDAHGERTGTALVLGLPDYGPDPDDPQAAVLYNSAHALGTGEGRYLKRRLVPFGEYVPLEGLLRGLIDFFDLPMSRARSGPDDPPPLALGDGLRGAMAICYEIAYPDLVRASAADASLVLTISNDAWFGDSFGPVQHLQIARTRAVELARPVVRATNDGVTALIDARGRVTARLPRFDPGVLTGTIQPARGRTPFGATGSWPAVAIAGLLLLAAVRRRRSP
jgi:apolipoprotein N-acyltransferase